MNRRTFNATGLAALLSPLPQFSLAQNKIPGSTGFQVAEFRNGIFTTHHGGMATSQTLVDDYTLFQVASCSKTVTALAVLTLVRDGWIELDKPAAIYLKGWQLKGPRSTETTVAELMSHTAGTTVHGFEGYNAGDDLPSLEQILEGHAPANSDAVRTRRRLFAGFSYSGGGTMVLQKVIEDVTGTDFGTYAHKQVLVPTGARRATFALEPSVAFAHGYFENGQPLAHGYKRHPESAAAGLWATASDLAKILHAIVLSSVGAQNAVIPPALAKRMITPVHSQSGLGLFIRSDNVISHDGRNHGFDSFMTAELKTGRIYAVVTNRNGALESVLNSVLKD